MLKQLMRAVIPESMAVALRRNPVVRRLRGHHRIQVGVGRGLVFNPGRSNASYASGHNELPLQEALSECLKPGAVFYDIGANVGFFTVIGAQLVGSDGHVYAFEPVPENADFVRLNVDLNRFTNVELRQIAIASGCGTGELTLAEYSGGAVLTSVGKPPDASIAITVELASVDHLVFAEKLRPPSVVKIDVEGAELEVMQGMARTLMEIRPVIIYEIDDGLDEEFQKKYRACQRFMEQRNYRVDRLPDSYASSEWLVGHAIARPC